MEPERSFTVSFTSDIHGYFSNLDYSTGKEHASGLCNCAGLFARGENTLIIDGGDTIQGSPFTYYYQKSGPHRTYLPSQVMNAAGYHFITLGNHDFNYGVPLIETYLKQLNAVCLCANVAGIRGVEKTAVITLENGLRVGLTGVTSHYVNMWEPPEHLKGITVSDAFTAASEALEELRTHQIDVAICIYHGGFERDLVSGCLLSDTNENQGWRICKELGFDILLTGHQHGKIEGTWLSDTFTCQCPDKASGFMKMDIAVSRMENTNTINAHCNFVPAGKERWEPIWTILAEEEKRAAYWLDEPVGYLNMPLLSEDHIEMAVHGSLLANFFNQVQLDSTGAEISLTCLGNTVKGLPQAVSIRDIVSSYVFPNTLKVLEVDRRILQAALERCAEYFSLDANGDCCVSESFLVPVEQHYNFDFFSGIEAVIDLSLPIGNRVVSIRYQGEELPEEKKLKLCMNNYRATGAGGYPFYTACPIVSEIPKEVSELIMDYISSHRKIEVDCTKWLTVNY